MQAVLKDVPNSKLYVELRELDLKIEQFSNRKKAEICDLNEALDLKTRCLRLQLFNRHFHQVFISLELWLRNPSNICMVSFHADEEVQDCTDPARPPSWSFYIAGHFIDHNQGTTTTAAIPASAPLTAASLEAERKARAPADRFWTSAMEWVQMRIERPGHPSEVVRWERNRHIGQHKEMMEIHRCLFTASCS